ncbi:hypothetical protein TWF506_003611 [Arthrobotrys conoides]|uniref:Uncharacterized protein n=1 Tax=Arthrobotrys conoides TaxID=74498 RepID=A0AAN8P5H6_9PEZI
MVAVIGALTTFPPLVAALGSSGASAVTGAAVAGAGALEGLTAGAAVSAIGEGAVVATGAVAGGSSAGIALATLAGPIGCLLVGCEEDNESGVTWDCWKAVVRDESVERSKGMEFRTLVGHENVKGVREVNGGRFLVENVFGEKFLVGGVEVGGRLALHASMVLE